MTMIDRRSVVAALATATLAGPTLISAARAQTARDLAMPELTFAIAPSENESGVTDRYGLDSLPEDLKAIIRKAYFDAPTLDNAAYDNTIKPITFVDRLRKQNG